MTKSKIAFPLSGYHKGFTTTNKHSIFEFVEPYKMYTVVMPATISAETRRIIAEKVWEETGIAISQEDNAPFGWMGVATKETGIAYQGSFLKRLMNYMWKEHDKRLEKEGLGTIGNIVGKELSNGGESAYFMFDPIANYAKGQFGDSMSCFWGANSAARMLIRNEGGAFVEFFDNPEAKLEHCVVTKGKGIGRCWVLPVDQWLGGQEPAILLCNAYGDAQFTKYTAIRSVSTLLGMTYKNITMTSNLGRFYVNGSVGYLLTSNMELYKNTPANNQMHYDSKYDQMSDDPELNIPVPVRCGGCGGEFYKHDPEFATKYNEEKNLCMRCYDRRYPIAECCGERVNCADFSTIGKRTMCRSCWSKAGYETCEWCGRLKKNWEETSDHQKICVACINSNNMGRCSKCNHVVTGHHNVVTCADDTQICRECFPKYSKETVDECDYCRKSIPLSDKNENGWCHVCAKAHVKCANGCGRTISASSDPKTCYQCQLREKEIEQEKERKEKLRIKLEEEKIRLANLNNPDFNWDEPIVHLHEDNGERDD